ncbi:SDR family oxidoreductase [Parvibaculum sedimenti]|uniref:SDR family oxidoreductase n=1 Tax=Parvibaculum sedimenti TaxID=2608632 RepID=A0A6N6VJ07_9HYPH|nr:SDR family oxidoreductase [Parvibaculum sedimenti]KAB7739248.1 SDR family oxidoreductase [Parvibaculum sedimenti]
MGRVTGKIAIVTGAAKGIGAASAKALAREGAKVICTDLDETAGEAVVAEIQRIGGEAVFMHHDVCDEGQWERVTKLAEDRYGGLHIVVNNAGIAPEGGPIEDKSLEDWRHTIAVDLDSVFLGCKHGIRTIKKTTAKGALGSIINISSILGLVGSSNAADYVAAKGGVRLLTKAAALECADAGYRIRVNSVHPGYIDTPMVRNVAEKGMPGLAQTGNEVIALLTMLHPIGRLGVADEIANTVLFLASDESSFTTGAELVVDGGYTTR